MPRLVVMPADAGPQVEALAHRVRTAAAGALAEAAEAVLADARERAPMATGRLRASGRAEAAGLAAAVGFGGGAAAHALAVHENLDPAVDWSPPGTGPKYLERAGDAEAVRLADRVADRLRRRP